MHTYLHMYIVIGKHQPEQTLMCSSTGMEIGLSMPWWSVALIDLSIILSPMLLGASTTPTSTDSRCSSHSLNRGSHTRYAYPISHCLIPPYPDAEANDDASKALFNFRHSGARMEMTEHIYGIWKRRFPIAENLRNHLPNAIKIINATAILHNISILWEEIGIDQLDGQPDPADVPALPAEPDMHVDFDPNDLNPLQMRQLGQATRDNMRLSMDPNPTARERRRLGRRFQN